MEGTATQTRVHIRWSLRRDWKGVKATGFGWKKSKYLHALRQRNVIGMVAEDKNGKVVGVMIYRLGGKLKNNGKRSTYLRLLALAVHPDHRRQGIGRQLFAKLAGKMDTHGRTAVVCTVGENNLPAQLALRAAGYVCERVLPKRFGEEAGYQFVLTGGVRWRTVAGVMTSRCGRWRVFNDWVGWVIEDCRAKVRYQYYPSPADCLDWVENANRAG